MSQHDDSPRLDRQADRMEEQERRLEQDLPQRSEGGGGPIENPGGTPRSTPTLDRMEDRLEDQERRLENDQPPRSLGGG